MSELTSMRDHCRRMATTSEGTAAALAREITNAGADEHALDPAIHEWLTKARRDQQLWTQLADEIDARLAEPDDPPDDTAEDPTAATEHDQPLWETP